MTKRKHPGAVALAKRRAKSLSPERRAEIARIAGKANGRKWAEKRRAAIDAQQERAS